jgi:hypothetical protein
MIEKFHVGGIRWQGGSLQEQYEQNKYYQEHSRIPVLIAANLEKKLRAELTKLLAGFADKMKYSDPVSSDKLAESEQNLKVAVDELEKAVIDGDKESARKLWQQIKDINPDYFNKQPDFNPLK